MSLSRSPARRSGRLNGYRTAGDPLIRAHGSTTVVSSLRLLNTTCRRDDNNVVISKLKFHVSMCISTTSIEADLFCLNIVDHRDDDDLQYTFTLCMLRPSIGGMREEAAVIMVVWLDHHSL